MRRLETERPLDILYRGTLSDTAMLVGLVQMGTPIRSISLAVQSIPQEYITELNLWLTSRGQPNLTPENKETDLSVLVCPRKNWGWGKDECVAVIRLSGLSLPPGDIP